MALSCIPSFHFMVAVDAEGAHPTVDKLPLSFRRRFQLLTWSQEVQDDLGAAQAICSACGRVPPSCPQPARSGRSRATPWLFLSLLTELQIKPPL